MPPLTPACCAGGPWYGCHVPSSTFKFLAKTTIAKRRKQLNLTKKDNLPDISLDPNSKVLTFLNNSNKRRTYFVSVRNNRCINKNKRRLNQAVCYDNSGRRMMSTTFIVVMECMDVIDVCTVTGLKDVSEFDVYSDIVIHPPSSNSISQPSPTSDNNLLTINFPLPKNTTYKCSQSSHGLLTHTHHVSTHHAIDFDCSTSTPILAAANGTIIQIVDGNVSSGPDVANLFTANYLTMLSDDGRTTIEYVHIQPHSTPFKVGAYVTQGTEICKSGNSGFTPSAHLHIEAHIDGVDDVTKEGLRLGFFKGGDSGEGGFFECVGGSWYDCDGEDLGFAGVCGDVKEEVEVEVVGEDENGDAYDDGDDDAWETESE